MYENPFCPCTTSVEQWASVLFVHLSPFLPLFPSIPPFLSLPFTSRKKLSKFSQHPDWRNASNYVAKRYMKEAGRQVYFQDVKLQMDAKLWGEEYNKHRPPKKVCWLVLSEGVGK